MLFIRLIIYILFVHNKLSLKTIEKTNKHKIDKNIQINFTGPINFLRTHYYVQNDLIMKKRVYSPELEYELEIKENDKKINFIQPNYKKSKIKKYKEWEEEEIKYVEGYHKVLGILFQYNNKLTIKNNGTYSFYKFINSKEIEEESEKLFAALLLIGEGIPLKLKIKKIDNIRYLLLEEEVSFKMVLTFQTNSGEMSYSSVQDLVKIFTTRFIKWNKFIKKPDTSQEFIEGLFTMSPNFIIQSYLYELIEDDSERLIKIIDYCYKIMQKYKKEYSVIYSRCFTNIENNEIKDNIIYNDKKSKILSNENIINDNNEILTLDNAINDLKNIETIKVNKIILPFDDNKGIPDYNIVKILYKRGKDRNSNKYSELDTYANCCEISIFSLLSFLFYNKNEQKYSTKQLNNKASKEMILFFTEYNDPRKIIFDNIFHQKWSDILAGLSYTKIRYVKFNDNISTYEIRNELKSGIINTLRIICFLCGLEDDLIKINDLELQVSIANNKTKILTKIIKNIFEKITVNINYIISVMNIYEFEIYDKYDFTGVLELKYKNEGTFIASMKLIISSGHQRVELLTQESQFCNQTNKLIKCYKNSFYLIEELHNNFLQNFVIKNHKIYLEETVLQVLEKENVSYIDLCAHFGLILNAITPLTNKGLNVIHIYLILRIHEICQNIKENIFSQASILKLSRLNIYFLSDYALNSSEVIFQFFLSLFKNIAAAHDLEQKKNSDLFLMPLVLFDKNYLNFKKIILSEKTLLDLFNITDLINLIIELNDFIISNYWIIDLLKDYLNLAIKNLDNGCPFVFPSIFFYYEWDFEEELIQITMSILTKYIQNRHKVEPFRAPHLYLFPVTSELQKLFIHKDNDFDINWLIFYLEYFDHCCYVETLKEFDTRLISIDSDLYSSYFNYIFNRVHNSISQLLKITYIKPIKILAMLLNNATSNLEFVKTYLFYKKHIKIIGFDSFYDLLVNNSTKFYNFSDVVKFISKLKNENSIKESDNDNKKVLDYMNGYLKFLDLCYNCFIQYQFDFSFKEKINNDKFFEKLKVMKSTEKIIFNYITIIEKL